MMLALVVATSAGWYTSGVLAALLWIVLFVFLGVKTLRKGHWVMFLVGIVIPLFWLIGALIPARR